MSPGWDRPRGEALEGKGFSDRRRLVDEHEVSSGSLGQEPLGTHL